MLCCMHTSLRSIGLHVAEPTAGNFCWVLSERENTATSDYEECDAPWTELRRAPAAVATYHQAMAQGLLALESMIDDLDQGPRRTNAPAATSKQASKEAPKEAPKQAPGRPEAAPQPSFFGFGPAR